MRQRGFTVLEFLVATAVLAIVLLGISTFYASSARIQKDNTAQTFLQRQATLIIDQMISQIGAATASSLVIPCPGGVADSIQMSRAKTASDPAGWPDPVVLCFHRDAAGTGLLMDTPNGGQQNLLSGAPVTLTTTTGPCPGAGGFCPTLLVNNASATMGAVITLRLRFQLPESTGYQAMTFTTTIAARN